MHGPFVILLSEIYNLQMGIAGGWRTTIRLPDNLTTCIFYIELYEHVPCVILANKVSSSYNMAFCR